MANRRPGAFSAYRVSILLFGIVARKLIEQYIALQNDDKGNGPLKQYFLGETMHGSGAGIL